MWQHDNGQVHSWSIRNGRKVFATNLSTPVDALVTGVGDVGGDRRDNLLFRRANGQVSYWEVGSNASVREVNLHTPVGGEWRVRGVGAIR